MAATDEGSKIFTPLMPSLLHLATVKAVLSYFTAPIEDKSLEKVYEDIQDGISENYQDPMAKRWKEKLMIIPAHLRHTVFKGFMGIRDRISIWGGAHIHEVEHLTTYLNAIDIIHKSDGTINRIETAQKFILNENINIRERFRIASMYCFEESVLDLWKEMEASGEAEDFETSNHYMMNFWVRRMQGGSHIPWWQALKEYLISLFPLQLSQDNLLFISPLFTLLRPEEREQFLPYVKAGGLDNFVFCVCAATKEEELKLLKEDAKYLLSIYSFWPLQPLFLEKAEKVWRFLDAASFSTVLHVLFILCHQGKRKHYDYPQLFLDFWSGSPIHLKEAVKEYPQMRRIILLLNKINRERRSISGTNAKRWVRKNGRLERVTRT